MASRKFPIVLGAHALRAHTAVPGVWIGCDGPLRLLRLGCGTGARVAVTADYLERARTGRSSGDRDVGRRRGAVRGKWLKPARVSPDPISPFAHPGVRVCRTCTRVTCSNAVLQGVGAKAATLDTSTDQPQST